jgi:hypothetical protein
MKAWRLVTGSLALYLLIGIGIVSFRGYQPATVTVETTPTKFLDQSALKNPEQVNAMAAPCCQCKQLRKYEEIASESKQLKTGMTQQQVEQILGKPDYLDGLNNYCYCTDRTSFAVAIPLVVQFDKDNKIKQVSFIEEMGE